MKYCTILLLIPIILWGQSLNNVELTKIDDSVWVHTTYKLFGKNSIPSNGLVIQTSKGIILIDTPWDDTLTISLLDSIHHRFNQSVLFSIITHAHQDRIGGIGALHKNSITTVSLQMTRDKAKKSGYEIPDRILPMDTVLTFGDQQLEFFYPGAGHTADNSIVWLPKKKILFGGCLIKSESFSDLGNISDANLTQWPASIQVLMIKYPSVHVVVPGHGTWGTKNLLNHTLDLLEKVKER